MTHVKRDVLEVLISFPSAILVDGSHVHTETPLVIIKPGESGYYPYYPSLRQKYSFDELCEIVAKANGTRVATAAEREAALIGSMFGWDAPGADPLNH